MTRPSIVRADTIDLQDHEAPSAKDHHRPNRSNGAHQAETLREVAQETLREEQLHSPRLSWNDQHPQHQEEQKDLAAGLNSRMRQEEEEEQQQHHHHQQEEDALAVAQNGGISSSDEGDLDGDDFDDDMMDRISSSPSIEDEDIDFEFVYALHTFVATVEGQANATKGDTMVLLDDSNSYWWLVRVVKDSSIGYLPAEHIETPTERLARLNKHRNVDLSQSMLGDQTAKSKNSFKSIRKRWKSVTFSEPTYVDYTGGDYSSDEDDIDELFGPDVSAQKEDQQQQQQQQEDQSSQQVVSETEITDEGANVAPLRTRSASEAKEETTKDHTVEEGETRNSDEIIEGKVEGPSRSRNGTLRNTDSFFKDDTVETKKISLTPNLLRDDGASRPSSDSTASKDTKTRPSLDSKMEKELVSDKESKKKSKDKDKDKKSKDKKPSAIRNFFSKKDKRRTSEDDDGESFGKRSMDVVGAEYRDSEDAGGAEDTVSPDKTPSRSPSKLQKHQPRTEPSPTRKVTQAAQRKPPQADIVSQFAETRTNDVSHVPPASMRIVDPETKETKEVPSNQQQQQQQQQPSSREEPRSLAKSPLPRTGPEPQKTVQARQRMDLDDSDSSEAEEAILESAAPASDADDGRALRPQLPGAFPDSYQTTATTSSEQTVTRQDRERLSESPVEVSPVSPAHPPGLTSDSPTRESPSPELGGTPQQQAWDDTKLRAFFDEGEHVRDLLAVVYDTSDVDHTGHHDHPLVNGLFREQNAKLAEITTQLDNMLGDWLARKHRSRGAL